MKMISSLGLVTVLGCAPASAEGTGAVASATTTNAAAPYMRTVEDPTDGTVQMQFARRHLVPASGRGPGIWLVGTGHIALKSYYQEIQAFLNTIPLVLYEDAGVTASPNAVNGQSAELSAEDKALRARWAMFPAIARTYGLVCQPESMDYHRPNFQFCDLTHAEVMALLEKSMGRRPQMGMLSPDKMPKPKPMWVDVRTKAVLDKLRPTPIARQMVGRLKMIEGSAGDMGPDSPDLPGMKGYNAVVIGRRNAHLLAKITELAQAAEPVPDLAVFYGAGHLPAVEREVCAALGYQPAEEQWSTGFSVSPASLNLSPAEFRLLRAFIHQEAMEERKALSQMTPDDRPLEPDTPRPAQ